MPKAPSASTIALGVSCALTPAVTGSPARRQSGSPPSSGRAENPLARSSRTAAHVSQVAAGGVLHLGQAGRREILHLAEERGDTGVREAVVDPDSVPAGGDQPGACQHAQLGGGVGAFICAVWGQVLYAALPLGEQVKQFQPGGSCRCWRTRDLRP